MLTMNRKIDIIEPEVKLIASTKLEVDENDVPVISSLMELDENSTDAEDLVEFSGRLCYLSFRKPNEATRKNSDYINRTVFEQKHGSIAEHASASLLITGVSRSFLAEITRHRHLSFSVLSQRFVDESNTGIVIPPAYYENGITDNESCRDNLNDTMSKILDVYESLVEKGREDGLNRKQAREAARSILPNMTEVKMVVTGNLRSWSEVVARRTAPDADAEIQHVMRLAAKELNKVSPVMFPNN